jgi:hypothetical protein
MEDLSVQDDLTYTKYPIMILDTLTHVRSCKVIKMCKVQWSHHGEDEATWEREEELCVEFSHLFPSPSKNLEDEILCKGGRICNTQIIKLIKELISLCDLPSTFETCD